MYTYIVEAGVNTKKYENELAHIESRLIELEISGRLEKLTILKSLKEIINDAVRGHSETVVLIGSDKLVNDAMSTLADADVTIGIIPVGEHNTIAEALGIPNGIEACDVLSARITATLDLGRVNNRYFLSKLYVPPGSNVTLECDSKFKVSALTPSTIDIANFTAESNPQDGHLDVVVRPEASRRFFGRSSYSRASVFPFKKLTIRSGSDSLPIMSDGETIIKTPATVEITPKKLKVIVGKNRKFA